MSAKSKVLIICAPDSDQKELIEQVRQHYEPIVAHSVADAMALLGAERFAGVYLSDAESANVIDADVLLESWLLLEAIPDGVAVLARDLTLLWANRRFRETCSGEFVIGKCFYEALGTSEILGPDFSPLHSALASNLPVTSTLRSTNHHYYQVTATPVANSAGEPGRLIVLVHDITDEMLQQKKLAAIHQAGIELADLTPEEIAQMSVQERIELLKANIVHHTKHLLQFDTVEIRLLDRETGRLEPLLAEGMDDAAAQRELIADPQGNGVTGFVAATGKSYLCEDTTNDPLYLPGAPGAKSSLTVPLMLHDEVIGTFNVESPEPGAFTENDLQFLEIFSRDVAAALNTLELLVAEKMTTASESVEAIHREVVLPVDEILNDAVCLMERYIGHESEVADRLRHIVHNARHIKQLIQKVGEEITPAVAHPPVPQRPSRPILRGSRVLVADNDDSVRRAAHDLLGRYGCVVETAHDGQEALSMGRSGDYDVVLADIRLPDMSGYECFCQMREILSQTPVILMTGFGYDPTHSIVKARQEGLATVLYKPFRIDQLLEAVEKAVARSRASDESSTEGHSGKEKVGSHRQLVQ